MLGEQRISEQRSTWDNIGRKSPMFDNRSSKVTPTDTSMTERLPTPTRVSQIQPQYRNDEKQIMPYSSNRPTQQWQMEPYPPRMYSSPSYSPKQSSAPVSTKKYVIIASVIGVIIGLCLCGIPLGVITTLYLKLKSEGTSSNNGTTNGGTGNTSSVNLPAQCTTYTALSDSTRLVTCTGIYYSDCSLANGWYRVTGGGATKLATVPSSTSYCCTSYPGWYNGTLPTTPGSTTLGMYCVNYSGYLCYAPYSVNTILVTNCNDFYVYYLTYLPSCNSRYCITA